MTDRSSGDRSDTGRIVVVVSRFNESVTHRLLRGASDTLASAGLPEAVVDVVRVAGAVVLPVAGSRALATDR